MPISIRVAIRKMTSEFALTSISESRWNSEHAAREAMLSNQRCALSGSRDVGRASGKCAHRPGGRARLSPNPPGRSRCHNPSLWARLSTDKRVSERDGRFAALSRPSDRASRAELTQCPQARVAARRGARSHVYFLIRCGAEKHPFLASSTKTTARTRSRPGIEPGRTVRV